MKYGKQIATVFFSIAVVVILFWGIQKLVIPKYADDILEGSFTKEYYKETTNHDVIMIGDCEVYENIDPIYLWEHFGITSYIRGNAQQLTWQSYYMLEDTLQYEIPDIVIYNVQALTHDSPQKEEYNRMTLDGMKWSAIKYHAIKASMCEGEQLLDYFFPILRYHERITKLNKNDITYFNSVPSNTHNGYYMRIDVLPASKSDVADTDWLFGKKKKEAEIEDDLIEDPWAEIEIEEQEAENTTLVPSSAEEQGEPFGNYPMEYLDNIRKLCEKNNITLLLMKAPSLAPIWYASNEEQVKDYAEKYHLPYLNFYTLLEEIGMDYETDTYDGGLHLNRSGADKLSQYLGAMLQDSYKIKDHRKERKLAKIYKKKVSAYQAAIKMQKKELKQYGKIISY